LLIRYNIIIHYADVAAMMPRDMSAVVTLMLFDPSVADAVMLPPPLHDTIIVQL